MGPTIRDIAAWAKVSPATVSRVFSGNGYVGESTRNRILAIAAEHGFQPKIYKKRNKSVFCSAIGIVVPDICNAYYMDVIHGMESILSPRGAEVLICNTDEDPRKEVRCLETLRQAGVKGVVTVPVSEAEWYNTDYLEELERKGVSVVLLDRDTPKSEMDGVFMDNFSGAYQSVRAFISNGHTRIAMIAGPDTSTSGKERMAGYCAAMREAGLPIRSECILEGDFKFDLAYELTEKILKEHPEVTAIFASNSQMARGCLAALKAHGVSVPDDMGFISCGNLNGSFDRISCVVCPTHEIGVACAELLLRKMTRSKSGKSSSIRKRFQMELMLRGSEKYPVSRAPQ